MSSDLKIDWCSYRAAKFAIERWHYSKRMPIGKLVKIGVWENKKYIGCVLFGRGATPNIGKPYKLEQVEICELVRIALNKHKTPVTQIIKIAIIMLKEYSSNLKLIVSYSDLDQNHLGKIYQAGNWVYTGLTMQNQLSGFIVNGNLIHPRSVGATGIIQSLDEVKKNLDPNAKKFISKGKHKYLYPLTKQMRKQIEPLSKPYPKRLTSIDSDASNLPVGNEGGANPTVRL